MTLVCRSPGQFRKRRAEALAAKSIPAAYHGSQSAMASYGQQQPSALVNPSTYRSGRSAFAGKLRKYVVKEFYNLHLATVLYGCAVFIVIYTRGSNVCSEICILPSDR